MALFSKKNCDVCGGKIGMLGNRKLEDGNLCKDCAKQLSPYFSDRKRSTVADIKEQLAYREANKADVAAFNVTRTLGTGTKVLLDEDAEKFIVSSAKRWQDGNPDVLNFSQVTGCLVDIDETRNEIMQTDSEGKEKSYTPPRYEHDYDFYITIHVNHPYFDQIRYRLNSSSITVEAPTGRMMIQGGADVGRRSVAYREHENLAQEIKDVLTQVRQTVRDNVAAANAPKQAVTCPFCGATTTPDAQGRCEFCQSAINS
ncbi:MAG: DUF4428 domain-containing protein [Clostridiaceae bacterium]|nr:DUF4428 domain-containing protein [Clostridiaceae bacterium]